MTTPLSLWNWSSPAWLAAAGILAAYLIACRNATVPRTTAMAIGLALFLLSFVSPIGVLADGYLFSAHMVQHLILLLLVPMMLLLSVRNVAGQFRFNPAVPIIGWTCGIGAMWFWHVPAMCAAATESPWLAAVRDLSLVAAGLLFWWPIFAPIPQARLAPLAGIVYLFSACLGCTLLGIYITFTTISVCPAFANPVDRLGIVTRLYDAGLTPSVDQQLGGLLMWVPPCALYVSVIMWLLCRWYRAADDRPRPLPVVSARLHPES